jgi:hypothetical protein
VLNGLLFRPGFNQIAPKLREDVLGPQRPVNAFLGDGQQGVAQLQLEENARVEQHCVHVTVPDAGLVPAVEVRGLRGAGGACA